MRVACLLQTVQGMGDAIPETAHCHVDSNPPCQAYSANLVRLPMSGMVYRELLPDSLSIQHCFKSYLLTRYGVKRVRIVLLYMLEAVQGQDVQAPLVGVIILQISKFVPYEDIS